MLALMWLLNIRPLRRLLISRPFLKTYLRMLPTMSATEREALEAGSVWWDGELFTGKPDWSRLLNTRPGAALRRGAGLHRRAVEQLCAMVDDFDVTPSPRGPAARSLGIHQARTLLGNDHPEAVRRAGTGSLRAVLGPG